MTLGPLNCETAGNAAVVIFGDDVPGKGRRAVFKIWWKRKESYDTLNLIFENWRFFTHGNH